MPHRLALTGAWRHFDCCLSLRLAASCDTLFCRLGRHFAGYFSLVYGAILPAVYGRAVRRLSEVRYC